MKIKDLYRRSIKLISELDARVLIKFVLKIDETIFYRDMDLEISDRDEQKIQKLISRRANNEPIAYIVGYKEFYGLNFFVDKNVLIPRPESEWLVEQTLKRISVISNPLSVLDMGTGSGNIIISIIKSLSTNHHPLTPIFYAADISTDALKVAKKNAKQYQIDNIKFFQSDLFSNIDSDIKFDIIIANLPYVPKNNETIKQLNNEPFSAIFTDDNGAAIIKRFLHEAINRTNLGGWLLVELDPRNAKDIKNYAEKIYPDSKRGTHKIELKKDLANLDRYLIVKSLGWAQFNFDRGFFSFTRIFDRDFIAGRKLIDHAT